MKSLKMFLVLGLTVLLIGFTFNRCDVFKIKEIINDNGNDNDDNGPKFVSNVKIEYERIEPFISTEYFDSHVYLSIHGHGQVEGWEPIRNTQMTKNSSKEFSYTVSSLPYETKLWMYAQDWGRSNAGGPEFNGRIFKVMGTELTEKYIRKDPSGNGWDISAFIIKKDNTVVPWE